MTAFCHEARVGDCVVAIEDAFVAFDRVHGRAVVTVDDEALLSKEVCLSDPQARRKLIRAVEKARGGSIAPPDELVLLAAEDALRGQIDAARGSPLSPEVDGLELWPLPVDGADVLDATASLLRTYVCLPPGADTVSALFAVYTNVFELFDVAPMLVLTSAVKRSGKTTFLEVISGLVHRPLLLANTSVAALFREIDASGPTVIVDEADTFLRAGRKDSLVGILNSGNRRATGFVVRTVSTSAGPRTHRFRTFGPKIIAGIGAIPSTLQDRGLLIPMGRRGPDDHVHPLRYDQLEIQALRIRSKILRWVADNHDEIEEAVPEAPASLNDRQQQLWQPLLAVAEVAGGVWLARAHEAAIVLSAGADDESDHGLVLLRDLEVIFAESHADFLSSEDLLERLADSSELVVRDPRVLARLLRPFGVRPRQRHRGGRRGYLRSDLEAVWRRYLAQSTRSAGASASDASLASDVLRGMSDG